MPTTRLKPYQGPAFLSGGFRPFFLLGAFYSGLSILLWLPIFYGKLEMSTLFSPVDWHIHELYFGFLPAVITGFLFTAVPNWTGRLPIRGMPLAWLVLLWVTGRIAISFSVLIGWKAAMIIDVAFLSAIVTVTAREIMAGSNWRNLKVLAPLTILLLANIGFHLEAHYNGVSDISRRLATLAVITLIMLIGGRIIPSFTRNWLARENPGRMPIQFAKLDMIAIAVSVIAMADWVIAPQSSPAAPLLITAAVFQIVRLARWAGYRTIGEPLVTVLHISYLFIPVGFALIALSIAAPGSFSQVAGVHALSVGAIGGMTLSVMVRASLGHMGQRLHAGPMIVTMFAAVFLAAIARIMLALDFGPYDLLLHLAGLGWLMAFVGFSVRFAPSLLRARAT
ncbi:MAG: NnrS family protein [Stappiaceae bacterium]